MTTSTTTLDDRICEQLCAYMDGELSEAEARFLRRRFEHDLELRAKWERLQLASACLKRQPVQLMPTIVCARIHTQLNESTRISKLRPLLGWGMAASLAVVALVLAPRMLQNPASTSETAIATLPVIPANAVASPASADLVARYASVSVDVPSVAASTPLTKQTDATTPWVNTTTAASPEKSPLPLLAQSPENFPLLDNGDKKTWPRSTLPIAANDPALEAYLVRHNQMLADDGFGGFFPYVDVVANPGNEDNRQ